MHYDKRLALLVASKPHQTPRCHTPPSLNRDYKHSSLSRDGAPSSAPPTTSAPEPLHSSGAFSCLIPKWVYATPRKRTLPHGGRHSRTQPGVHPSQAGQDLQRTCNPPEMQCSQATQQLSCNFSVTTIHTAAHRHRDQAPGKRLKRCLKRSAESERERAVSDRRERAKRSRERSLRESEANGSTSV